MTTLERFNKYSKGYKSVELLESDLKQVKKINNIISKWLKTERMEYKLEVLNIMMMIENIFETDSSLIELIEKSFIDEELRPTFKSLYGELYEIKGFL